jgi:hypothetical protein
VGTCSCSATATEKAVELDPNYADAHVTLGFLKWQPDLDWRGAEEQLRQAIALCKSRHACCEPSGAESSSAHQMWIGMVASKSGPMMPLR